MATAKEVKNRLKSVRDTKKITNAMYLIASTKLRKARSELALTRPYFQALREEIGRIFRTAGDVDSRYIASEADGHAPSGPRGCLVITADKGLAGAYNQNVIREAVRLMNERETCRLFVVGEYGRHYFASRGVPIEESFLYTAQEPTVGRAREIGGMLLDLYDRGELSELYVVYTDMQSALASQVCAARLLPFDRARFAAQDGAEDEAREEFEFVPSREAVLESIVPGYVTGFLYSALVDSFCSEQNARMNAMDSAGRNAQELLDKLTLQYNHIRQNAITQEITEVSAGAKSMKRKAYQKTAEEARPVS